jgi:hypothetical protein
MLPAYIRFHLLIIKNEPYNEYCCSAENAFMYIESKFINSPTESIQIFKSAFLLRFLLIVLHCIQE